ncbi:MAG: hypothetical protein J7496_17235 [Novosphingobium sp.]|nr:hypothetical protein [Novosphingobium sp.]MBO9604245.1 hypothetical protein [Novosphingobium sp.]
MKARLALLFPLTLAACFPGNEFPNATLAQVEAALTACHVKLRHIEHQDADTDRWLVSIDPQEPDAVGKAACLEQQQDEMGAGFAMSGPAGLAPAPLTPPSGSAA